MIRDRRRAVLAGCGSLLAVCTAATGLAMAHGAERGLVMLLPTGYYVVGGALAVGASFLLLAVTPDSWVRVLGRSTRVLLTVPAVPRTWTSSIAFAMLCALLIAGVYGATDPFANPLPLFVWTLWWVCFTVVQSVFGNLWPHCNPWTGPVALLRRLPGLGKPRWVVPEKLGYVPAIVVFTGFVWFELIDPAPDDPGRLAAVAAGYWVAVLIAILLCGEQSWFARAEPFAIFFRLVGACSPFLRESLAGSDQPVRIRLTWPGTALVRMPAMPLSGIAFVLLTLSSVSFDGLSKTFTWLAFIGVNPLEYPGRSAVTISNTLGLLGGWVVLSAVFFAAVYTGCLLARRTDLFSVAGGRLVYSLIPISLVFHIAHYLTVVLVNSQYAVVAFNDPFAAGWNLLGAQGYHVSTSMLTHYDAVSVIWTSQTVVIAAGHVFGIIIAHRLAIELYGDTRLAALSQVMLAALTVLYTIFGLWLLSTPSVG